MLLTPGYKVFNDTTIIALITLIHTANYSRCALKLASSTIIPNLVHIMLIFLDGRHHRLVHGFVARLAAFMIMKTKQALSQ